MTAQPPPKLPLKRVVSIRTVALIAAFILVATHHQTPQTSAQEPEPPLGDCFSGVFNDDPLHCYVLEQTQSDGTITIDKMYLATGARDTRLLHIYLTQKEAVGDAIGQALKQKAARFMNQWPEMAYTDHDTHRYCISRNQTTDEDCLLNVNTLWTEGQMLPFSRSYTNILLHPGGAEARKSAPGWASYQQVWPSVARISGQPSSGIDVSNVDTANIPAVDCGSEINQEIGNACGMSWYFNFGEITTQTELTGWETVEDSSGGTTVYAQIKAPGRDAEKIRVATEELGNYYPDFIDDDRSNGHLVVIPVEYSFEDYWRWAILLNRFAVSSGNTVGIVQAEISGNYTSSFDESAVTLRAGVSQAATDKPENLRTTITLWTMDSRTTLNTLPGLLTALGIPNDAVGVVVHQRHQSPEILYRADIKNPDKFYRNRERDLQEIREAVQAMEAAPLGANPPGYDGPGIWLLYVIFGVGIVALGVPTAAAIVWFVRRRRKGLRNVANG